MKLTPELTTDLSAGMYDSVAPTAFPRTATALILNGRIQPDGTVRRRPGTIRTSAAVVNAATGFGAADFFTAAGVHVMVSIFGDTAKKSIDEGATWSLITAGLRQDYWSFATMRVGGTVYLYGANGDATVKRYDGTTWGDNPNSPAGVKYLAVFNGRLDYAGHSGVIVQGTKITDPSILATPDGLLVQVNPSGATEITGLLQLKTHLLVFGRSSTSYIDGYGEQTIIVGTDGTGFSRSVGCVAFRTAVAVGDDAACWLSNRGVEYWSPTTGLVLISKAVQGFLKSIDWQQLTANPGRPSACYDEVEQNYHLALSTTGSRNNRTLVLNLLDNVLDQRPGKRASASIDRQLGVAAAALLFGDEDGDGYLDTMLSGVEFRADALGYARLASLGEGGDLTSFDGSGYLSTVTDDTLPATLFTMPVTSQVDRAVAIHSLGYDGFVRRHHGVNKDDLLSDGSGGVAVTLDVISRPFLLRAPRNQKRVRAVHVASLQDAAASLRLAVRAGNSVTPTRTVAVAPTTDSADRKLVSFLIDGDTPQVEAQTEDDVRLSLLGVSAGLLREGF